MKHDFVRAREKDGVWRQRCACGMTPSDAQRCTGLPVTLNLLGVEIHLVPEKERGASLASYSSDREKGAPNISIGEDTHGWWYAFCYLRKGSVTSFCLDTGTHGTPQQAVDGLADQILTMKRELSAFDDGVQDEAAE